LLEAIVKVTKIIILISICLICAPFFKVVKIVTESIIFIVGLVGVLCLQLVYIFKVVCVFLCWLFGGNVDLGLKWEFGLGGLC
jgi:fatty acid desaturase